MHGSEISKCLGAAFPVRDSIKAGEGRKRYGGRHSPFWGVRATKEATTEESFKALMKRPARPCICSRRNGSAPSWAAYARRKRS